MSRSSHYEISPREREDEQRRHHDEFDAVEDTYDTYMSRLSERPRAGTNASESLSRSTGAQPGTGRSESRDKEAA